MLTKINIVIMVAAVILFITKPSQADIEQEIKSSIITDINSFSNNSGYGPLEDFLQVTCKLDAENCYKIIRSSANIVYKDIFLFWIVGIDSQIKKEICFAALKTMIYCSKRG